MGVNFNDYDGLQPKMTHTKINTSSSVCRNVQVGCDADYRKIEHLSNIDEIQHGYSVRWLFSSLKYPFQVFILSLMGRAVQCCLTNALKKSKTLKAFSLHGCYMYRQVIFNLAFKYRYWCQWSLSFFNLFFDVIIWSILWVFL